MFDFRTAAVILYNRIHNYPKNQEIFTQNTIFKVFPICKYINGLIKYGVFGF